MKNRDLILMLLVSLLFAQCHVMKHGNNCDSESTESLVDFQITKRLPMYYMNLPIYYSMFYPDSMGIMLSGKNVEFGDGFFQIIGERDYCAGIIYMINKRTNDTLKTIRLQGINLPYTVYICGSRGGKIEYKSLLRNQYIFVTIENFGISIYYPVMSFTMVIQEGDSVVSYPRTLPQCYWDHKLWDPVEPECGFFSVEQLDALARMKGTQLLIFRDIVIDTGGKNYRTLEPVVYYLVKDE